MIERAIVEDNVKEFQIQEYVANQLRNVGHSHIKLQKTPLGEKIIIYASRPGLIVGRKGQNIKKLTEELKNNFKLENPQIEINEVENINLDSQIVAERIASSLEKFGIQRFKGVGHRVLTDVMNAGALGVEILMSGKIPSSRAKRWRFYLGYLKKCGDIALTGVNTSYSVAGIKTGVIGIQVRIMPPQTKLPDDITILDEPIEVVEEVDEKKEKEEKKVKEKKSKPTKKTVSKTEKSKKTTKKDEQPTEKPVEVVEEKPAETVEENTEEKPVEEVKEAAE